MMIIVGPSRKPPQTSCGQTVSVAGKVSMYCKGIFLTRSSHKNAYSSYCLFIQFQPFLSNPKPLIIQENKALHEHA